MKLAQKLRTVCESLDNAQLSRFWDEAKKHLFSANDKSVKDETLLLNNDSSNPDDNITISDAYQNDLDKAVDQAAIGMEIWFEQWYIKDYVATILNDFVLKDRASTEVEDQQALDYMLKNLKSIPVGFETQIQINYYNDKADSHTGTDDVRVRGVGLVEDFRYDKEKDRLYIDRFDVQKIEDFEQK